MNNQIDYIDQQILEELRKDARKAYSKIAEKLKVSNSLIHQRIKKMTELGIIKRASFLLDEYKLGYKTKSFTGVRLKEARYAEDVLEKLEEIAEITECNSVSGDYAIFIVIYSKHNEHLRQILYKKVHLIEGVAGTDTFICFDTRFSREVPLSFNKLNE